MEVVLEESHMAGFSIALKIGFTWSRRAPKLWHLPLVFFMDEACRDDQNIDITVGLVVHLCTP
jgi:hypothetical protein